MLGAELLSMKGRPRIAVLVHHSVAALVFSSHPVHLCIHALPHQLQQGGGVKRGGEDGVIESLAYGLRVVRMAVQLAANVEHLAAFEHLPDHASTIPVFTDHPHNHPAMRHAIGGGVVLAMLAPIPVAVPVQKSDKLVVDLVQEAPHPVHPEWLKSFDPRAADQWPASGQVWLEPPQATFGDLLINVP